MKTSLKNLGIFLFPALALIFTFLVIPILVSFYMSFHEFGVMSVIDWRNARFIGLDNYKRIIFMDSDFHQALKNTLFVLAIAMPVTIGLSLFLAVLINSKMTKFKSFFRVGFYIPAITNTVAVALVWKWILNGDYGILNYFLNFLGIEGPQWLIDPDYAIYTIIFLVVWKALGPNVIIFIAGLQSIPETVNEAAEIDGANRIQKFFHITMPLLSPTILYISLMILIGYLQLFDEPFMLTKGGPLNSTISIVMHIYNEGFRFFNFGYASALSFILFFGIFTFSLIRIKTIKEG